MVEQEGNCCLKLNVVDIVSIFELRAPLLYLGTLPKLLVIPNKCVYAFTHKVFVKMAK